MTSEDDIDLSESALERVLSFLSPSATSKLSIGEIMEKAAALIESEKNTYSYIDIKFSLIYEHALMTRDWLCLIECRILAMYLIRFCFLPHLKTLENPIMCRLVISMP
ncbi:hypothetical protein ACOME3_004507 [Neoechinorhynchus agilis]